MSKPNVMSHDYQLCRFVGGPHDGDVGATKTSTFPDGTLYAVRQSRNRPDWLAVYRGEVPMVGHGPPVMMFDGWQPKSLAEVK